MTTTDRGVNPLDKLRPIVWAQAQAGSAWLRERELSPQQAFVLNHLAQHPGSIQRELVAASRTTAPNMSGVLRVLEARGLITRDAPDERSKRVFATAEGLALIVGHEDAMADVDRRILEPLNAHERAQLAALLDKITAGMPDPVD